MYKNGEIINLTYQAVGVLSGAAPTGIVLDQAGATHSAQTTALNSALTAGEKTDGRYHGHFTPAAEGRWTVLIADKNGDGEVAKNYNVCGHNIDSLGDAQVAFESGVKSAVSTSLASAVVIAESGIKSDALLVKSAIVSSIKQDADAMVASQLLLTKSALVSSILVDCNASTSDVKSAVAAQASDVKSAVLAVASPAMVS